MATPRGKRPIPLFKLIKSNPPRRYCSPKARIILCIPRLCPVKHYIAYFSGLNNLKPSHFIVQNELVIV